MVGECGTGHKNKTYRYYKCITQKRKHACDKKTINKDYIENLVLKAVMDKIMDDELMDSIADSLYELQNKENTVIPNIKLQIAETEKYIENIVNALQQGIIFDSTKKRLTDLEEKKKELEDLLIQEQIKSPILTKEQILFGLTKFRNLDVSTMQGKQRLIDSFVNAIYLYDDYFIITCNYKDGNLKVSFDEINNSDLLSNGVPKYGIAVWLIPYFLHPKRKNQTVVRLCHRSVSGDAYTREYQKTTEIISRFLLL